MLQPFTSSHGHRWEADAEVEGDASQVASRCPSCGEWAHSATYPETESAGESATLQPVTATVESSAYPGLDAPAQAKPRPLTKGTRRSSLFPGRDVPTEDEGSELPEGAAETRDFQEHAGKPSDQDSTNFTLVESRPLTMDRSTAVTLRFSGLRRENRAQPLPTLPGFDVLEEI